MELTVRGNWRTDSDKLRTAQNQDLASHYAVHHKSNLPGWTVLCDRKVLCI